MRECPNLTNVRDIAVSWSFVEIFVNQGGRIHPKRPDVEVNEQDLCDGPDTKTD